MHGTSEYTLNISKDSFCCFPLGYLDGTLKSHQGKAF